MGIKKLPFIKNYQSKYNEKKHQAQYFGENYFGESDFGDENKTYSIQYIAKVVSKVTSCSLPKALQERDAFKNGDKSCNTCSMDKEKYKCQLQIAKVIETILDDVIEREEAENINVEKDLTYINKYGESPNDELIGKENKISLKFSVYIKGDVLKHNLKCVLVKLQRTIGDLIIQICFMKSRQLCCEERYKMFDVSTSNLRLLKYEFSNLTDSIVPLLKESTTTLSNTQVCVTCVKQTLWNCNERWEKIVKSGRNVRLKFQKSDQLSQRDQCCIRDYPHVHAVVQGKPIVLKYSMKPPSKQNKTKMALQLTQFKQDVLSYEWPDDFLDQGFLCEPAGGDLVNRYSNRMRDPNARQSTKAVPFGDENNEKGAQLASTLASKVPYRSSKPTVPSLPSKKDQFKKGLKKSYLLHKSPSEALTLLSDKKKKNKKNKKSKATVATPTVPASLKNIKKTRSLKMIASDPYKKEPASKVPFNTALSPKRNKSYKVQAVGPKKSFLSDSTTNYPLKKKNNLGHGEICASETSLVIKRSQKSGALETAPDTPFISKKPKKKTARETSKAQKHTARQGTPSGTSISYSTLGASSKVKKEKSKTTLNSNMNSKSMSSLRRALFTKLEFRIKHSAT